MDRLDQQAQSLVQRLAAGCQNSNLGSATVTIYDTAWVSMVTKTEGGEVTWVFPECFQFVLENQLPNGGWQCYSTHDDGLLNTLAALLAIRKQANRNDMRFCPNVSDLEGRISKATTYLRESLQHWDVDESLHVGFEILIPALLSLLESENIQFAFTGRERLERLRAKKLSSFDPEILYRTPSTFLHSLEAFIDQIDFDRLSHHKVYGSMMASPASTAAYLMRSSTWDNEAELYLRKTLREGSGNGTGAVPSVFPMPIFEVSWVLSTLLQGGFRSEALGKENIDTVIVYLQSHYQSQHGLLGFAPSVLPDADDTAKTILTLNLLAEVAKPDQMIDHFKSENSHFRTYPGETDASFSANCNVLIALTHMPDLEGYSSCIESIITFLSEAWWNGAQRDKWNKSQQYAMMLLAQALTQVLVVWDRFLLKTLPETLIRDRIMVILIQILNRTLLTQKAGGAWSPEKYPEITAYGILTLKALQSFPWHLSLQEAAASGIRSGQSFLDQSVAEWGKPAYVWIEKVTYGSARLSEGYCLAAMKVSRTSHTWSNRVKSLVDIPERSLAKLIQLFTTLEDFQNEPRWKLVASALEGYLFLPQLKLAGSRILPEQKGANNEYLAYIPFTWILVNNYHCLFLSANMLWDMMVLTVCNFRVDEYMESAVTKLSDACLEPVKAMIRHLCNARESDGFQTNITPLEHRPTYDIHLPRTNGVAMNGQTAYGNDTQSDATEDSTAGTHEQYSVSTLTSVRAVLSRYMEAMLNYPRIAGASTCDRSNFRSALCAFLLSHIAQIADNSSFATQSVWNADTTSVFANPRQTFFNWAHTTGAESVSCPFSFAFLTCLLGAAPATTRRNPSGQEKDRADDYFGSARQKYLAQELCMHLAVMSRLYNDFGSVERDRIEGNVNSVNFPDFHGCTDRAGGWTEGEGAARHEMRLKEDLLELARHERASAEGAAERLLGEVEGKGEGGGVRKRKKEKADAIRLFVGVTRLYADLYVARDLSNRVTT